MTNLSPAAQAVLDAFWDGIRYQDDITDKNISAALRAAVDQLGYSNVPEEFAHLRPFVVDADDLLAIATELEGNA